MHGIFVLDLHDLDAAGKEYSAALPVDWLSNALTDTGAEPEGPGDVTVRYSRTGNDVVVHGRVRARVLIACGRCLEPVGVPIDTDLSLLLVPAASGKAGAKGKGGGREAGGKGGGREAKSARDDEDLPNELLDVDTYSGEEVRLDPFLRDALLLELPSVPLCSESCPGIAPPPETGERGGVDPRLAPLLSLSNRAKREPN